MFGSHEIGTLATEYEVTTASNTRRNSDESSHSAVKESHDNAVNRKELHRGANQTLSKGALFRN